MSLDTQEAIREFYKTATQQELKTLIKHPHEEERYQAIHDEAQSRRIQETQDFHSQYDQRLAEAQQIILRETHGNILELPTPEGIARIPDKDTLLQMAEQRIRHDHEQRLSVIQKDEINQYQELRDSIANRDHTKNRAMSEFNQVSQQIKPTRSGPLR